MKLTATKVVLRALLVSALAFAIIGEETVTNKGTPIAFQTEVSKVLEIFVTYLYTNRNVFLRETISNGSDALDKIRIEYLKNPKTPKNDVGEAPTMDIRISVDPDKQQMVMRDGGVGMTKEELANNLGTLGASGTKKFEELMQETGGGSIQQIGQFGVGFYSVFLVSERVRVASKSDNSDTQWVWESTADGTFFLFEDPRGNTLGRGTEITFEIKKDAKEYLDVDRIKEIVHKYSEFIHFPIYVQVTKMEKKSQVVQPAAETTGEEEMDEEPQEEARPEGSESDDEEVITKDWELINANRPIWTRPSAEIEDTEYDEFYKSLSKDFNRPMFYTHFFVEGEVEFQSILFVPMAAPMNIFESTLQSTQNNIQLYVRRVFITDDFKDLLPRYLNFVRGIVDSDGLPLHVSRDILQESRILKVIKKKLVRKALIMISDIAQFDKDYEQGPENAESKENSGNKKLKAPMYDHFWTEYGKHIRLGLIEDGANRARLTKLLRYKSSKSDGKLISLEQYVDRMTSKQRGIYYLTGDSIEKIIQSPYLEDAIKKDIEVLYMSDTIDEYVVSHITDFADKKLINLAKESAIDEKDSREKSIDQKRKEKYSHLLKWVKDLLDEKVAKVIITRRHVTEPMLVVSRQHHLTSRMQRLMKGQSVSDKRDPEQERQMKAHRVVELNHLHPLIDEIYRRVQSDDSDPTAKDLLLVLFDTANIQSEFDIENVREYSQRINRLLRQSVDISPDAPLLVEDVSEYEVEAEPEEEETENTDGNEEL